MDYYGVSDHLQALLLQGFKIGDHIDNFLLCW